MTTSFDQPHNDVLTTSSPLPSTTYRSQPPSAGRIAQVLAANDLICHSRRRLAVLAGGLGHDEQVRIGIWNLEVAGAPPDLTNKRGWNRHRL